MNPIRSGRSLRPDGGGRPHHDAPDRPHRQRATRTPADRRDDPVGLAAGLPRARGGQASRPGHRRRRRPPRLSRGLARAHSSAAPVANREPQKSTGGGRKCGQLFPSSARPAEKSLKTAQNDPYCVYKIACATVETCYLKPRRGLIEIIHTPTARSSF